MRFDSSTPRVDTGHHTIDRMARYLLEDASTRGRAEIQRRGREDVFDNLIPLLSTFKEPPLLKFEEPVVDGERAVLLASGSGMGPTGAYHQPYYGFATRVKGDEFSEIIEFADTVMLETAIFGRKLVSA